MQTPSRTDAFCFELRALFHKFGVQLYSMDQYDGNEEYCGTDYSIEGEGIYLSINDELAASLRAQSPAGTDSLTR